MFRSNAQSNGDYIVETFRLSEDLSNVSGIQLQKLDNAERGTRYELTVPDAAMIGGQNGFILSALAERLVERESGERGNGVLGATFEQQFRMYRRPTRSPVQAVVSRRQLTDDLWWWKVEFQDGKPDSFAEITLTKNVATAALQESTHPVQRPGPMKGEEGEQELRLGTAQSDVAEKRVEQIIRGAYEVISSKGFANASMREIATAAGMPIPTMYHYIGSKDDLLSMIFEHFAGRLAGEFQESLSQSTDLTKTLRDTITKYVKYCETNRKFINLIYRETRNINAESRKRLFELDKSFTKIWKEILRLGTERGEFKVTDPDLVAEFIYFLCTIWAIRYWSLRSYSEEQVSDALIALIFRGVEATRS